MVLWKTRGSINQQTNWKLFVAVHGIAWSGQAAACASERPDAVHPAQDETTVGMDARADSGSVAPSVRSEEGGALDASRVHRDARAANAAVDASGPRDANLPDARPANRDASDVSNARADGSAPPSAERSAGCGKAGRPNAGRISVPGDHTFVFPASYDGSEPFPLLIGFHAAGNPMEQIENLTKGSDFEQKYIRAFPKSKGSAWDYATDIGRVMTMYDALLANHCVDVKRIFATGHSSGAQLIVQIMTKVHEADADHLRFKAVAPVAASRYGSLSRAIPVLYIQGARDNVRNSDGSDAVKEFTVANGCLASSTPYAPITACNSGGKSVEHGCRQYAGCTVPTVWCSHDDPQYSNTNHGWPCFATQAMHDFFAALP